jgi:hypothetical protein
MGDPTSGYATAGIALRVSGALKPHHIKVETPSVGNVQLDKRNSGQVKNSNIAKVQMLRDNKTIVNRLLSPDQPTT